MKTGFSKKPKGFTLIELSLGMAIGLAVAGTLLILFNNQIAFLRIYRAQSFLNEEAPVINMYVSRLVAQADRFSLYDSLDDALANQNPRFSASPVLKLSFRQPNLNGNEEMRDAILSFGSLNGQPPALYYYVIPRVGAPTAPEWAITHAPRNVSFSVVEGIIRTTLTGPNDEIITYSGAL